MNFTTRTISVSSLNFLKWNPVLTTVCLHRSAKQKYRNKKNYFIKINSCVWGRYVQWHFQVHILHHVEGITLIQYWTLSASITGFTGKGSLALLCGARRQHVCACVQSIWNLFIVRTWYIRAAKSVWRLDFSPCSKIASHGNILANKFD